MQHSNLEELSLDEMNPAMVWQSLILFFMAITMGAIMAAVVLPAWLPGLSASLLGPDPKVYWYLSRATAMVSFGLLWLAMAIGLMISNKMARVWPGGPLAYDLHQYASLLGLGFALFHAIILIGDQYIGYSLSQVFVPFSSVGYMPFWVGMGQIGLYIWAVVAFSFYIRKQIGTKSWRAIHFLSFALFGLALVHGISSGSDSELLWVNRMYWYAGGSLMFLIFFRIFVNPRLFPTTKTPAIG
jgi:predicted ferric reductase